MSKRELIRLIHDWSKAADEAFAAEDMKGYFYALDKMEEFYNEYKSK